MPPSIDEEDDDTPRLDPTALAALQSFYTDRDAHLKQFQDLKDASEAGFDANTKVSMSHFSEDWNASQFWYTDATATTLAEALLLDATAETSMAIVSAPSVYVRMRSILQDEQRWPAASRPRVLLLEFDDRFAVFKDEFVRYDFHEPMKLDGKLKGAFDRIICDPPFLSEDCQTKTAITARWLARDWAKARVVVCTGERMGSLITRVYGAKETDFLPEHAKGLSNEFRCYANFEWGEWKLR